MRAVALVALLLLAACGKRDDACAQRAKEIAADLRAEDRESSPVWVDHDRVLVTRTDIPRQELPWGPTIEVTAAGLMFQGQRAAEIDIAERLESRRQDRTVAYVASEPNASWHQVVAATALARDAGYTRVGLLFHTPPRDVVRPPRSAIDAELDALMRDDEVSNRATKLAEIAKRVVQNCTPITRAFGAVASTEGTSKAEMIILGIEEGLVECNCMLDVPSLHSLMWRLLHTEKPVRALVLDLVSADPSTPLRAGAQVLAAPGDTPWSEVQKRLTPEARGARFATSEMTGDFKRGVPGPVGGWSSSGSSFAPIDE